MLPDDRQLVNRDTAIPGLKHLFSFNDQAELRSLLGWKTADDLRINYLKYKPASSCLAEYRACVGGLEQSAYVVAFAKSQKDKLARFQRESLIDSVCIESQSHLIACRFPFDRRLSSLNKLVEGHDGLITRLVPSEVDPNEIEIHRLRYKPERRFVGRLDFRGETFGSVKLFSRGGYERARRVAKKLETFCPQGRYHAMGQSERHAAISYAWLPGTEVSLGSWNDLATDVADVIARLHNLTSGKLPKLSQSRFVKRVRDTAEVTCWLWPDSKALIHATERELIDRLSGLGLRKTVLHGDLHIEQLIVGEQGLALIDFDRSCLGRPEWDLACLRVDVENLSNALDAKSNLNDSWQNFLNAYSKSTPFIDRELLSTLIALRRFELAIEPFRERMQDWGPLLQQRVSAAYELIRGVQQKPRVLAIESFDIHLPWFDAACDRAAANNQLGNVIPNIRVDEVQLIRHKPARRALVVYRGTCQLTGAAKTLVGKTEHRPRHNRRFDVQRQLWQNGFHADAADGISVAKPFGMVPEWNMWLQAYVDGENGWDALGGETSIESARLAARAIAKVHRSTITIDKTHTLSDEMKSLSDRLQEACQLTRSLKRRIEQLRNSCQTLIEGLHEPNHVVLHRDFYPDQLLFRGEHVTLLDFDLICLGPASIDVGNFTAHLVEMGIRRDGDPSYYMEAEQAFVEAYLEAGPDCDHESIELCKLLALARHVYISQTREPRRPFTADILTHCEQLLAYF